MLPKNNSAYTPVKIGPKTVQIKPWKTKQQKDYLIFKASLDDIEDIDYNFIQESIFNILLANNVKDYDKLELSDIEKMYLLVKLRELSISDKVELTFTCSNEDCKFVNEVEIPLMDIVNFKPPTYKNVKIGKTVYYMKQCTENAVKEKINGEKLSDIEISFIKLVLSIDKIIIDNKEYKDFSYEEMYDYISEMESKEFGELFDKFSEMEPSISFVIKTKCVSCGNSYEEELGDISDFFWE